MFSDWTGREQFNKNWQHIEIIIRAIKGYSVHLILFFFMKKPIDDGGLVHFEFSCWKLIIKTNCGKKLRKLKNK